MNNTPLNVLFFPVTETTAPESSVLQLKGILFGGFEKPNFIDSDDFIVLPDIYDLQFDYAFRKALLDFKISKIITTHLATYTKLVELGYSSSSSPQLIGENTASILSEQNKVISKLVSDLIEDLEISKPNNEYNLTSLFLLTQCIPGGSNFQKIILLYLLSAQTQNGVSIEVGVMLGKSAIPIAIGSKLSNSDFLAIDTWDDLEVIQHTADPILKSAATEWNRKLMQEIAQSIIHLFLSSAKVHKGDSNSALQDSTNQDILKKKKVTFLHVDANHDFDKVLGDFNSWAPLLADQNYVVFDDTHWRAGSGPRKLVNILIARASFSKVKDIAGSTIFWDLKADIVKP
jgi:cephalosporin hydroxylase